MDSIIKHKELIEIEVPQDDSAEIGEKLFLYGLLRALKPKVIVETGTHKGKTTLYMLCALQDNGLGHLHTYDPFEWGQIGNFRKFPELEKLVTYYQQKGKDCQVDNIDFAFIDGFHETEVVLEEINSIAPRLTETGIMVFHDCLYSRPFAESVNKACELAGLKTVWLPTFNGIRIYGKANQD